MTPEAQKEAERSRQKMLDQIEVTNEAVNGAPDYCEFIPHYYCKPRIQVTYESFSRMFVGREVDQDGDCFTFDDAAVIWVAIRRKEAKRVVLPFPPAEAATDA